VVGPAAVALASLVDENRVAINVAPRQFLDYRFVERLKALLAECRLPTSCIELELTESVLQTGAATIRTLEQLRAMDIAVALDDLAPVTRTVRRAE
jgi:EAL domain-containing protein (putative c-di-GMP-specific phosphodiesterase class I)